MITWLYPERCPVCMQIVTPKGAMVHPECKSKLDSIKEPVCYKCGMPLSSEDEEYCTVCSCKNNRGWDQGRSIFPYHGSVGNALRLVKKDGRVEFVRFFAKQIKEKQQAFILRMAPSCIVPVPLHPSKQRLRGFNQAELLARALGEEMNLPVCLLLKKQKKTKDQKSLGKNQRIKNVADAFAVDEAVWPEENVPESVLLLDDVSTTGSTLTACANTLKARGVKRVAFISVCVAEQPE
ncbi:MAG: ComF family protein [Lachnospiraceae bacterium]|nr:ComF family protein [Lachnospiraceae bacterium]